MIWYFDRAGERLRYEIRRGTELCEAIPDATMEEKVKHALKGLRICHINATGTGGGVAVYQTIPLPAVSLAVGGYFVLCGDAATVADCDLDVSPDTNLIQNGAPDAVAITGDLVDGYCEELREQVGEVGPSPVAAEPEENEDNLHWLLSRITSYAGVMNYMGARFTAASLAQGPGTEKGQWTTLGGDFWNTRYTPADQITPANFKDLEVAWRFNAASFGPPPVYDFSAADPVGWVGNMSAISISVSRSFGHTAALAMSRELDIESETSLWLTGTAIAAIREGKLDDAAEQLAESRALSAEIGFTTGVAYADFAESMIARHRDDTARARTLLDRWRALPQAANAELLTEFEQGFLAVQEGSPAEALAAFDALSSSIPRRTNTGTTARMLELAAAIRALDEDPRGAAELLGRAEAVRSRANADPSVPERRDVHRARDRIAATLSGRELREAMARGGELGPLEQP